MTKKAQKIKSGKSGTDCNRKIAPNNARQAEQVVSDVCRQAKPVTPGRIYDMMFEAYGSQGWWPVTPVGGCRGESCMPKGPIYGVGLKNEKQRLEIMFGAVLAQNTQWKPNVENAIIELNRLGLIDIGRVIKTDHETLAKAIRSSGYFNQKAKKLKNVAVFLKKFSIARLKKMGLQEARKLLLEIDGVGPETADSILLYALDRPIFVVDAYTRRIFSRIGLIREDMIYDEIQGFFMSGNDTKLSHDAAIFNEYHALIVAHAKQSCRKKPLCESCCLKSICQYYLKFKQELKR